MSIAPPNEWPTNRLGDLARVYSGSTPLRTVGAYWGGRIPWVTTAEIDRGLIDAARETITDAGLNASATRVAPRGTLLLAMYGQGKTRGKVAMLGIAAAMNQACAAIETGGQLDARYLFHYLTSQYNSIRSMSNAGSQENLSGELVRKIPVLVPPIPEQRIIGQVLDDVDALISALQRQINKKVDIKQGLMQQLLTGKTRLPGFKEDWPTVPLGESGVITGGGVDKTSTPAESAVLLLNYMDVYRAEFIERGCATQVVTAPAVKIAQCSVRSGDVFFTPTSETPDDIARSAVAGTDLPGVVYSYHLVRWRPGPGWDPIYLGYAFSTEIFRSQASTLAAGSGTRYVVSMPGFRSLRVPKPRIEEQRAIGKVLRDTSNEIDALMKRLAKARAVKTGMMEQLLTGRTRLPAEAAS